MATPSPLKKRKTEEKSSFKISATDELTCLVVYEASGKTLKCALFAMLGWIISKEHTLEEYKHNDTEVPKTWEEAQTLVAAFIHRAVFCLVCEDEVLLWVQRVVFDGFEDDFTCEELTALKEKLQQDHDLTAANFEKNLQDLKNHQDKELREEGTPEQSKWKKMVSAIFDWYQEKMSIQDFILAFVEGRCMFSGKHLSDCENVLGDIDHKRSDMLLRLLEMFSGSLPGHDECAITLRNHFQDSANDDCDDITITYKVEEPRER